MKKLLSKVSTGAALAVVGAANAVSSALAAAGGPGNATFTMNTPKAGGKTVATDVGKIITNAFSLIMTIAALITFVYLIMGAIGWLTSGGDKGKVEEARNKITAAVIGLLILAASWAVFTLILNVVFGAGSLSFTSINE